MDTFGAARTKLRNVLFAIAALAIVGIGLLIAGSYTLSYRECYEKADQSKNDSEADKWFYWIECEGDFFESNNGAFTAIATFFIAWFTIVLTKVSGRQADLMVASQRAFVFARGMVTAYEINPITGEYNWRFRPVWLNSGDTPTRGALLYCDSILTSQRITATHDFAAVRMPPGRTMIGPKADTMGAAVPLLPEPALSPQDVRDIQDGKRFFYMWGWASYGDVFPKTERHITRFCWQILPVGDLALYDPSQQIPNAKFFFQNGHAGFGTCADDECALIGLPITDVNTRV